MKRTLTLLALTLVAQSPAARADDPVYPALVMVNSAEVFVPNGFDDNDESLAVLDGYLPSTCYKLSHTQTIFDDATKTFRVIQWARLFSGVCLQVTVPFTSEAHLGVLPIGDYKVVTNGSAMEHLNVKEANNAGPDDYMYAPIDGARIELSQDNKYYAVLEGRLTNTCMRLSEIKVNDSGRTIEVLPVIEMAERDDCAATEQPFNWKAPMPLGMSEGRHLLHVRSLNGKSVNTVFSAKSLQPTPR